MSRYVCAHSRHHHHRSSFVLYSSIFRDGFRSIMECDNSCNVGHIKWEKEVVTFMDNMLQMKILQLDSRSLFVPTFIEKVAIDPKLHAEILKNFDDEHPSLPVYAYEDTNIIRSGGIEITGLKASSIIRRKPLGEPVLEKYEFIPNETKISQNESVRVNMQMILENNYHVAFKVVEVIDEATAEDSTPLAPEIAQVFADQPLIAASISIFTDRSMELPNVTVENSKLSSGADCLLVIGSNLLSRTEVLEEAFSALKNKGFIISREPSSFNTSQLEVIAQDINIVTIHVTDSEKLVLLRKSFAIPRPVIVHIDSEDFRWLEELKEAVKDDKHVIIYSQNRPQSGIVGLLNCIRKEPGGDRARCFFILDQNTPDFDLYHEFYFKQFERNMAINVYKNGQWGTFKHLLLETNEEMEFEHCYAAPTARGDLSSIKWIQGNLNPKEPIQNPETVLVYVYYSPLNFKDVMLASGRLNADECGLTRDHIGGYIGIEYVGRTAEGRRVMGMGSSGCIANVVNIDRGFLIDVPDNWTMEEAATIPTVYITVLYGFYRAGGLKKGQSILIHSGAGGVGQAAINVALYHGCEVFTTVGTEAKRKFIRETFPQIDDNHIGNSRDTSFEEMIKSQTKGRGVDILLNSLTEEKLMASARCMARGGHFLEIGKFDSSVNNYIGLTLWEKEVTHHGVMVDLFFNSMPGQKMSLMKLLDEGIQSGCVKPLKRHLFQEDQIEEAFRFMASGQHIGKVIIKIAEEEPHKIAIPKLRKRKALPRYYCKPDKSYIICGGLGGFGLELADWLVLRGARKLILTSRKGIKNGYQASRIKVWTRYGTDVQISTSDITTNEGCLNVINQANKMGPVKGIFNLAVILKDALLENQSVEDFITSFAPKANATKHLDEISRTHCPELSEFVVFSSVSCGRGNLGQTNYGMANSVMERICEKRREDGYPAVAIEWGAVGDVGLVADMQEEDKELEIGGTLQQRISSCLEVMDTFLLQKNPVVASMVVAEKQLGAAADNCVDTVANILGIKNLKTVSFQSTLAELGMDSMRAVEVKQTLERDFVVILTAKEVRNLTFAKLQEIDDRKQEASLDKNEMRLAGQRQLDNVLDEDFVRGIPDLRLSTKISQEEKADTVVLLPGIEGVAKLLKSVAANLDFHAIGIQFAFDSGDGLLGTVERSLSYVEKYATKNKHFRIVGHSLGVLFALEIAAKLESKGYTGKLVLIDGYPEIVKTYLKGAKVDSDSDMSLISAVIGLFMSEEITEEHLVEIEKGVTIQEKIRIALELLANNNFSEEIIQNLEKMSYSMYKHFKSSYNYQPRYAKIKSPVILFKPTEQLHLGLPDDYGLPKYCERLEEVKVVDGNHSTIMQNPEISKFINQWFKE